MTLKIGLTGNIGSGKSVVARIFKVLGIQIFDADMAAREILHTDDVVSRIKILFGETVITGDEVNRQALADIVFADEKKLQQLNAIIHPIVRQKFDEFTKQFLHEPYLIYEAAILFESGFNKHLDRIISVTADEKTRLRRVIDRDQTTSERVIRRMQRQWPSERISGLSDFVIHNNETDLLIPQVIEIHRQLLLIRS